MPNSYYDFTTFDGFNLPYFAPFCSFCDFFNNFLEKNKPRKTCQNTANQRILGGIFIMIKILFICHGNICRSTMAQSVFAHMAASQGLSEHFHIDSAATSREEIGNPPHYGTVNKLRQVGIPLIPHRARQMTRQDYREYDYLIGMDDANIRNMERIAGGDPEHKIYRLLEFAGSSRAIADPWYTGNFDITYEDVTEGCQALLETLKSDIL